MNRVILSLFLLSMAIWSCTPKPVAPNPPVPVNIMTVSSQTVYYYDKFPATTQALSQVDLRPQVQGYITGIFFTEGSRVRKGQKLYEIDERLYKQAQQAAAANLKVAQGNLEQAQQDADRYVYLNSQNAVAKQLLDHAVIALQNAKNQVKAAEEALKTASTNLVYSVITAPFDGTIGFSQVKIGDLVSVGSTVLNTISTDDPMAVDFLVNEKQLTYFEKLQKDQKSAPDSLFTILLPDNTLYPHIGKISIIDRAVDPQTGAIKVRLVFPNPQSVLKVGMSCNVRVHNLESAPQIVVPGKAILEQMGEYFVFVVKDTLKPERAVEPGAAVQHTAEDTAHKDKGPKWLALQKKIQMGQTIGGNVIVLSGISAGEKIVVDGVQSLHDGSRVQLGGPKPATDSTGTKKEGKEGHKPHE